ncbi:heterokaryon incompatibility protein-domain-containing protein [Podospora aff. communis PSN243]|uniref:Heterokaryon incompatibility protein-domain-containing protein n=1 Tax=Podospora aff. communis PSN243 TaxID=3040156 RepID=A0AAV9G187_9PEZI|nr:heterokaryon incompatibility protein-domain-containing protein [Podospora aff. communis PSN243]
MRLLNSATGLMRDFVSDDDMPDYAILSHTWESDQEISFRQWEDRQAFDISHKTGFVKIERFCAQAARDGFEWVWVDTCCIDKSSSAELSEAINAMFRWYRNPAVCYVYLSDVPTSSGTAGMAASRWFTRGWTLQELIAPIEVRFYSSEWEFINTKANLRDVIFEITNINPEILTGGDLETISVARRMSWASQRKTSRIEDTAYSLLGIFDVNIPLIYGEGKKAFHRLQEAIMLKTHDQSLFAWGKPAEKVSGLISEDQYLGLEPIPWKSPAKRQPLLGLFADSPELFRFSSEIEPAHRFSHELRRSHPPKLVSGGVLLGLVTQRSVLLASHLDKPNLTVPIFATIAALICRFGSSEDKLVGLVLQGWGCGYCARTPELLVLSDVPVRNQFLTKMVREHHFMLERPLRLQSRDVVFRRESLSTAFRHKSLSFSLTPNGHSSWRRVSWGEYDFILRLPYGSTSQETFGYEYWIGPGASIRMSVGFRRLCGRGDMKLGPLVVEVSLPGSQSKSNKQSYVDNKAPMDDRADATSMPQKHSRVMKIPCDSWILEDDALPRICVMVERRNLDDGKGGAIDVIDLFIHPEGPEADRAKEAVMALERRAKSAQLSLAD